MPKGILFISYYFPPVATVGSLRNYNIAKELSTVFQKSFLITTSFKAFIFEEQFDLGFIQIFEQKQLDYRHLAQYITGKPDVNNALNEKRTVKAAGLSSKLLDSYPGNILWGEGGWFYIRNSIRKAVQLVESGEISHIYSSFRPMADHYIAYQLKRRFPQLVWIADFRDLPVDRHRDNVFFPQWHEARYRKILADADVVLTVSEGLKSQIRQFHDKVMVVKNGLRRMFLPENPRIPSKFTISYTGSLYPRFQNPALFFEAIKQLLEEAIIQEDEIRIVYAGKDHRIWKRYMTDFGLDSISLNRGTLSLSDSIRQQHESHLNLLLSWSGENARGILTGKLYEYLAAQRPVMCLVNGEQDEELEEMIRKGSGSAVFYRGDKNEVFNYLKTRFLQSKSNTIQSEIYPTSLLETFAWEKQITPLVREILQ